MNNLPLDQLAWKAKAPRNGPPLAALGFGDNSNTQFALLALWVGHRLVTDAFGEMTAQRQQQPQRHHDNSGKIKARGVG